MAYPPASSLIIEGATPGATGSIDTRAGGGLLVVVVDGSAAYRKMHGGQVLEQTEDGFRYNVPPMLPAAPNIVGKSALAALKDAGVGGISGPPVAYLTGSDAHGAHVVAASGNDPASKLGLNNPGEDDAMFDDGSGDDGGGNYDFMDNVNDSTDNYNQGTGNPDDYNPEVVDDGTSDNVIAYFDEAGNGYDSDGNLLYTPSQTDSSSTGLSTRSSSTGGGAGGSLSRPPSGSGSASPAPAQQARTSQTMPIGQGQQVPSTNNMVGQPVYSLAPRGTSQPIYRATAPATGAPANPATAAGFTTQNASTYLLVALAVIAGMFVMRGAR